MISSLSPNTLFLLGKRARVRGKAVPISATYARAEKSARDRPEAAHICSLRVDTQERGALEGAPETMLRSKLWVQPSGNPS
jgi:hypothetical protein